MSQHTSSIQESVMRKISGGDVRMHSRLYFTLIGSAMVGAGIAGGLLLAYLISIIGYIVRVQTASTPAYGARINLTEALTGFPWWLLVLAGVCIMVAIWLMRRYGRAYRHSMVSIIAIFIIASVMVGAALSFTDFGHDEGQTMHGRGSRIDRR